MIQPQNRSRFVPLSLQLHEDQKHCVKSVQIQSQSLYSVRIKENTGQKKLLFWKLLTQWSLICNRIITKCFLFDEKSFLPLCSALQFFSALWFWVSFINFFIYRQILSRELICCGNLKTRYRFFYICSLFLPNITDINQNQLFCSYTNFITLLFNANEKSVHQKRLEFLMIEVYKYLKDLSHQIMNEVFKLRKNI